MSDMSAYKIVRSEIGNGMILFAVDGYPNFWAKLNPAILHAVFPEHLAVQWIEIEMLIELHQAVYAELKPLVEAVWAKEDQAKVDVPVAAPAPVGQSGRLTAPDSNGTVTTTQFAQGWVTGSVLGGSNVRADARITAAKIATLDYNESLPILGREVDLDGAPYVWFRTERGYCREDVVRESAQKPTPPPLNPVTVSWGRWDAPTRYQSITNTFTPQHKGLDYAAPEGTPVVCGPRGGTVVKVGYCRACGPEGASSLSKGFALNDSRVWGNPEWEGGFGHNVVVQYTDLPNEARNYLKSKGWETYSAFVLYGHLKRIDVVLGQILPGYAQIGTLGTSGNSSGPHVHVELKFGLDFKHGFAGLERGLSDPAILFSQ